MAEQELSFKDRLKKTENFDQPYAPAIPESIVEVEVKSFEEKISNSGNEMLVLTVADTKDRTARINCMVNDEWIDGTIRLLKGLYTKNADEKDKEEYKEKVNKLFATCENYKEAKDKCVKLLEKMIEKGCIAWLKVEFKNPDDKYPDRALYSYEPTWRWKTDEDVTITSEGDIIASGTPVEVVEGLFDN